MFSSRLGLFTKRRINVRNFRGSKPHYQENKNRYPYSHRYNSQLISTILGINKYIVDSVLLLALLGTIDEIKNLNANDNANDIEIKLNLNNLLGIFRPFLLNDPLITPESIIGSYGNIKWLDLANYRDKINSLGDIIRVDNKFKLLYSCDYEPIFTKEGQLKANETFQLFVDKYHPELSSIKYADISGMIYHRELKGCLLIRFKFKNNTKLTFFIKKDDDQKIKLMLNKIGDLLSGKYVEVSRRSDIRKQSIYPQFWGGNLEAYSRVNNHYSNHSDPIFLVKFENHILNLSNGKSPLIILDIGAGKGRLAEKLILLAQAKKIPLCYILLEPEESQCDIANKKMNALIEKYGNNFVCQISIINLSIKHFAETDSYRHFFGNIHGIISSGGPLNVQVAQYKEAKPNLSIYENLLCNGGVALVSGMTESCITKKGFEKHNFDVLNMSEKIEDEGKEELIQFYVLEKRNVEVENRVTLRM